MFAPMFFYFKYIDYYVVFPLMFVLTGFFSNDAKKYTGLNKTISRKVSSAKSKWRTWTWHT